MALPCIRVIEVLQGKHIRSNVLLPLAQLHQFTVLVFMHKFVHHSDALPGTIHNYFTLNFN